MKMRIAKAIQPCVARPMVSNFDHCLEDLLYRHRTGELKMDVTAVVSNHVTLQPTAARHNLPFFHLPVTPATKAEQERRLVELIDSTRTELVVLARYMVALTYADATRFDPRAFHEFAVARLAGYAVPLFVRVSCEAELTTTFKLRKIDLQRSGYDPLGGRDALFVRDSQAACYVPVSAAALAALGIAPFAGD